MIAALGVVNLDQLEWNSLVSPVLGVFLGLMILLFIFRIVLTWYPQVDLNTMPWKLIALPTEPLLIPLRKLVPPLGGVDITPIIWVGIFSLLRELLLGQQGLLTMNGY
ncbi:MAG TPA: YggT family protein [Synechococcales cyanobacterium M55_K2018_004]|nr:YggT family protein [Synechococcales cyanobacterium M55_K2018_004]